MSPIPRKRDRDACRDAQTTPLLHKNDDDCDEGSGSDNESDASVIDECWHCGGTLRFTGVRCSGFECVDCGLPN